jgi:3-oxoadipate enol-lactonase
VTAPLVVLVHAGVADAGMWEGFDLPGATRHELRGAGDTPMPAEGTYSDAGDLEAALGGRPAALVGASFGGKVCLEVAARRPELVTRLVLLDCPLPDHDWSEEVVAFHEEEDRLLEEGDLDAATDLNVRFWAPDHADLIGPMQRRSFELQLPSRAEEEPSGPIDLAAVQAPTLVAVGEHDKRDFHEIADRLVQEIPDAERVTIAGAGHLPSLENPDETARLVREFLER